MQNDDRFTEQPEEGDVPADVPDPSGPPVPLAKTVSWTGLAVATVSVVACSGIAFVMLRSLTAPTMGATRSAKLQWEERRAEIDQVIEEELARRQAESDRSAELDRDRSDE